MDTQRRPELEDLVRYDTDSSAHRSEEENVERALSLLLAHKTWFAEDRAENK